MTLLGNFGENLLPSPGDKSAELSASLVQPVDNTFLLKLNAGVYIVSYSPL